MSSSQTEPRLTDDQMELLRQGDFVRIPSSNLGTDLLIIAIDKSETAEKALEETLLSLREQKSWSKAVDKARSSVDQS
jgi:lipopolysaccharide biosynthesis regulator YciM